MPTKAICIISIIITGFALTFISFVFGPQIEVGPIVPGHMYSIGTGFPIQFIKRHYVPGLIGVANYRFHLALFIANLFFWIVVSAVIVVLVRFILQKIKK